jgi:hypothetical protein
LIIAIKDKDRVVIGYTLVDSWGKLPDSDYVDEENLPIKFSDKEMLFACPDMNRRSDILLFDDDLLNMDINPKTIVKEMIPYIRESLKQNDKPVDDEGYWKNALIICDNEHIYDIGPKLGFCEADDYICHGYNVETIISVLDETVKLAPEERIVKAVSFACKLQKDNLFPLVITDTRTKQIKCIYRGEY